MPLGADSTIVKDRYLYGGIAPLAGHLDSGFQLLNAIEQAIIVTDLAGRIIYWNRCAETLYGWPAAEALGRGIVDLIAPPDVALVANDIMGQLRQGKSWTGEFLVRRKDGTQFPAEIVDSPYFDNNRRLIGIVGISRDISARKQADAEIRESENKYRTLVEQASDGIHTYDATGGLIDTNSKLCEMLGYPRDELLKLNIADLVPAEDLVVDPIRFDTLAAGHTIVNERRLRRKDGSLFHAEISGRMIQENVIQGIVRDVTKRKRAEERLRQSEERFRTILEASHDGILVEENERIAFVNRSYVDLFGFEDASELIGRHVGEIISPDDAGRVLEYGRRRARGADAPSKYEFKGKRRNGAPVDVEASVSVSSSAGTTYITTFVREIGDRKRLEMLMAAQKEALEMVVRGAPLDETLMYLAMVVDAQSAGQAVASILLLDDEGRLRSGASPGLPEDYVRVIDGLKVDGNLSTSRAAAASGKVVAAEDFAVDMKWKGVANLPTAFGLPAAWPTPIIARDGRALGTFRTYFRDLREPTTFEMQVVEILARTAALAIEQKAAEQNLRNNERQLRLITDAIPLLVSFVDKTMRYRFVNRAYSEWFSRPCEGVVGRHVTDVLGSAAYSALLPEIERALTGEEVVFERVIPYKNGSRFIHVNYIPETDASTGEIVGFHSFVQDISAQKKAEEILKRSRVELENRVLERTAALEKATSDRVEILHKLVNAQEAERQRIARDLHDQLGQQMTVLRLKLAALQKSSSRTGDAYARITDVRDHARQLDSDIDFLAWQFRPAVLDDLGLVAALDQYIGRWTEHVGVASTFDAKRFGNRRIDPEYETTFYRITQEALNNVSKHAGANAVNVCVEVNEAGVVLIIEDDGVGFEPNEVPSSGPGMGLTGMRERMALIGGTLEIKSARGAGTSVHAATPSGYRKENDE